MQSLIYFLYAVATLMSAILLKFQVGGVPLRLLILFGLFGLVVITYGRQVLHFFRCHYSIVIVFIYFAIVGSVVTYANGAKAPEIMENLVRHILQQFMFLVVTYVMCMRVGVKMAAAVLIAVALVNVAFVTLQFLGADFAWTARAVLGSLQEEPALTRAFYRLKARAMGLAFSPIEFSYLVVSAYIVVLLLEQGRLISVRMTWALKGVLIIGSVANETRSLLLGILLSELIWFLAKGKLRNYLLVFLLAVAVYTVFYLMDDADSRIATVEDQSAQGRLVLYSFGTRLFLDNPLGLGWGFTAAEHAWLYWEHLMSFESKPEVIYRLALHNSFINFALIYGVYGVMPAIVLAFLFPRSTLSFIFLFVSYLVNSFLHNKGIFVGAVYFWCAVAVWLYLRECGLLVDSRMRTVTYKVNLRQGDQASVAS